MRIKFITSFMLALVCGLPITAKVYTIQSLLGDLVVNVHVDKSITWAVAKGKTQVLQPSVISLQTDKQTFGVNPKVRKASVTNWKNDDNGGYQRLLLSCNGYDVEFRAFMNAAAYRIIPKKMINKVLNETSEYRFAGDYQAFVPYVNDNRGGERWCYSFESYYDEAPLSKMYKDSLAITPLAVCLPDGKKAVVMEADVENYPGMYLLKGTSSSTASGVFSSDASTDYSIHAAFPPLPLKEEIGGHARLNLVPTERANYIAEKVTKLPWRIVLVTDEDKQLVGNDIAKVLGPACRVKDTSWIKPGKVAWDWWNNTNITGVDFRAGINTETYKYFVDFARNNHLEYIIIDEGWSDPEDLLTFSDKMDMAGIINYAKENGVGVILWSSWRNLVQRGHDKMEAIMKHYGDMGVKGFKVDFFDRDDQKTINSVYEIAACAAKHHLLLDLHGMRPFGVQFSYPNIVNIEGVKGLENSKWEPRTGDGPLHDQPRYDVTIPFLRALPGSFDYTPGAMVNAVRSQFFGNNDHPMSQGTRALSRFPREENKPPQGESPASRTGRRRLFSPRSGGARAGKMGSRSLFRFSPRNGGEGREQRPRKMRPGNAQSTRSAQNSAGNSCSSSCGQNWEMYPCTNTMSTSAGRIYVTYTRRALGNLRPLPVFASARKLSQPQPRRETQKNR